jgi:hypothetical protein
LIFLCFSFSRHAVEFYQKPFFHGTGAERKQWYLEKKRGKRNKLKLKKQRNL